ncbi:hypothetical protein TNCV_1767941 [Trichonephila clavipes]|nr:hypothetical protein TNCV_1767941 [Trichonephila clavipes]
MVKFLDSRDVEIAKWSLPNLIKILREPIINIAKCTEVLGMVVSNRTKVYSSSYLPLVSSTVGLFLVDLLQDIVMSTTVSYLYHRPLGFFLAGLHSFRFFQTPLLAEFPSIAKLTDLLSLILPLSSSLSPLSLIADLSLSSPSHPSLKSFWGDLASPLEFLIGKNTDLHPTLQS